MTDPIRAALDKAACAICLCEGECFETRHGMMHGPCEKQTGKAANAVTTFLRALLDDADLVLPSLGPIGRAFPVATLADAVLAAAKDQPSSDT
jgi:hypothetical protein